MAKWEAFDVETAGELPEYALQPWRVKHNQAWLRTWAVSTGSVQQCYVADGDYVVDKARLAELLTRWCDERTVVCAWYAVFDVSWLCAYGLWDLAQHVRWMDGLLLWQHLARVPPFDTATSTRHQFGLKEAVSVFLPQYSGYDEGVDFDGDLLDLLHYNACDAWFTRAITRHLYNELKATQPHSLVAARIEAANIPMMGRANFEGVEVNSAGLDELDHSLIEDRATALAKLSQHGATEAILSSPKQLAKLLFDDWGLKPIKYSDKTGLPSTDKETLHELVAVDDRVVDIQQFRAASLNHTKFAKNIGKAIEYNNDGRAHPLARLYGTYSGRLTYSSTQGRNKGTRQIGWAIHQMKRSGNFRRVVCAPEDHVIVEFDAAGQEYRWMAILSGDETMLQLCMPGEDPHSYMAAAAVKGDYKDISQRVMRGDPEAEQIRRLGKVANLACQFRTSAKRLLITARVDHGIDMVFNTAYTLHQTYRKTYYKVPRYWDKQSQWIKRHRYVETLAGRRVRVSTQTAYGLEWSVESTGINFPIQGTGADQKHLALAVLQRELIPTTGARFLFDLHDGLYFVVHKKKAKQFIYSGRDLLNNLPYKAAWDFEPPIPLSWDAKVGDTWGNLNKVGA